LATRTWRWRSRPRAVTFRAGLRVKVDPDHQAALVLAEVETALRGAFSFARRAFGQDVSAAEVMAVAQAVRGVAVQVASLHRSDDDDRSGLTTPLLAGAPLPGERAPSSRAAAHARPRALELLEEMA
jgi:hypothetical protein